MMQAGQAGQLDEQKFDTIAWQFLCSQYTEQTYQDWPLERRLDSFLRHHGLDCILNDGAAYGTLLDRVLDNFGRARRNGVLDPPHV